MATIDSVGSQANRMEPIFAHPPYDQLIPQIEISYGDGKRVTLLDAGHRLGDALVRCVEAEGDFDLPAEAEAAFRALLDRNDADPAAAIAPTSLVFGAWDSRGTGAKLPRLVQSVIRAFDVEPLTRSAQYHPSIDYAALEVFSEDDKQKNENDPKSPLAQRGFVDVPATGTHGGVIARGAIERHVTLNLVALRRLDSPRGQALRRYVLGLSLVSATAPFDPFLRQGCLLVPDQEMPPEWSLVHRDGRREPVALGADLALDYARAAAGEYGVGPSRQLRFSHKRAKEDARKKKDKTE